MGAYRFENLLKGYPVIAAIKSQMELTQCLTYENAVVFILFGNLMELPDIVRSLQSAGKLAIVHADLIDGLSPREAAVDYIGKTNADGIISTKKNLVRYAKKCGLIAIQRFFIFDSMSMRNTLNVLPLDYADAIEILPGTLPRVIRQLVDLSSRPIIAGGLILNKDDVAAAIKAGAAAVSTTNQEVWGL